MRVRLLCRSVVASGFELAGMVVTRADDGAAAAEALKQLAADADVGALLIDDVLYRALPRDLLTRLDRQGLPLVAPVPTPRWDERSEAEAYVLEILRRAVGYRVRPR
jgi:vacuolar-type H+-ATPase subunit F/Vma7